MFIDGQANFILDKARSAMNLSAVTNTEKALDIGIELEKETILFYTALEEEFQSRDKGAIKSIIKEENAHWRKLSSLKRKLR